MNQVPLARPEWNHEEYFREQFKDITVLICQRNTRDLIQLCVTSILNHYPEIKILVADGNSQDESIEWLRFTSAKHPNITVWETGERRNSHGEIMHDAITNHVKTKYVLLMDSDTIVRRGGFIELMQYQFLDNDNLYATGSLMLVTRDGEGCGSPKNDSDVLAYAHPSCSLYNTEIYHLLDTPFTDHGAPCVLNNIEAEKQRFEIAYFPIDKYVQHLCGASWQEVPTVWNDDGDVIVRPLVTFILIYNHHIGCLTTQSNHDFSVITIGKHTETKVSTYDRGILESHGSFFDVRFNVNGHYVCVLDQNIALDKDFVKRIIGCATINPNRESLTVDGFTIYERKHWQKYHSIK